MNLTSNPIESTEDDILGVTEKAKYVSRIINDSSKRSLRIGLFGEWGSGKTSLLKIVENELLAKSSYKFFWFNPWLYSSKDDLLSGFNTEVFLSYSHVMEKNADLQKWSKRAGELIKVFNKDSAERLGYGKIGEPASALLNLFKNIAFSKRKISEIIKKNERRSVFIIEDLDRCDPAVISSFLLYLRELLDIEGVVTVFVTEYDSLSESLSGRNLNHSFIEKIYDLPIHVTYTNKKSASSFISKLKTNPFKTSTLEKYNELIPTNPRFLKKFCNQLDILNSEMSRYGEGELRQDSLFVVQLMKFRFPTFFDILLQHRDNLAEISAQGAKRSFDSIRAEEKVENLKLSIQKSIFGKHYESHGSKEELFKFFEALWIKSDSFPAQDLVSYGEFVERPISLTRQEMEIRFAQRVGNLTLDDFQLLKDERSYTNTDVLNVLMYLRKVALEEYFEVVTFSQGERLLKDLESLTTLSLQFILDRKFNFEYSSEQLGRFCEEFRSWSEILKPRGDQSDGVLNLVNDMQERIVSLFFENTGDKVKLIKKTFEIVSHHRRFQADTAFIIFLETWLKSNYSFAIDRFIDSVIKTKCDILCDQEFMSEFSEFLDEPVFIQMLSKFQGLESEEASEVIFKFFELRRLNKSLDMNYFTNYPNFIRNHDQTLRDLWKKVDSNHLSSWSRVKAIEIEKRFTQSAVPVE